MTTRGRSILQGWEDNIETKQIYCYGKVFYSGQIYDLIIRMIEEILIYDLKIEAKVKYIPHINNL